MAFNLRNYLEEKISDINPFDGGKTGSTIRANRSKPAPAQTVSRGAIPVAQAQTRNVSIQQAPQRQLNVAPAPRVQSQVRVVAPRPMPKPATSGQFNFGKGIKSLAKAPEEFAKGVAEVLSPVQMYQDLSAGIAEAASYNTKPAVEAREATSRLQQQNIDLAKRAGQKMRDPLVGADEKQRWQKFVTTEARRGVQQHRDATDPLEQTIERTDPVQGAINTVGVGASIADGKGIATAASDLYKVGAPVAKEVAKSTVTTAKNINRAAEQFNPRVKEIDEFELPRLKQAFDVETSPVRRVQINRQLQQTSAERRMLTQGGYIAGSRAKGFKAAQARGEVFDGVDGKPRFEVDDSGAKIKNPNGKTLGDFIDHPKLFKDYPQLRKTPVIMDDALDGAKGSFDGKELRLSPRAHKNEKDLLSTALHETQHNVQDVEGFAKGGDSAGFAGLDELRADNDMLKTELNAINRKLEDADDLGWSDSTIVEGRTVGELRAKKKQFEKSLKETTDQLNNYRNPHERYKALAGEAEARAVQARMNMPMSERYVKGESLYHGSPNKIEGDLKPSRHGEFGAGAYFSKDKKLASSYMSNAWDNESTGSLTEVVSAAKLKKLTREEFLSDRKKFYVAEEKLNGGEWDGNVAKRAEDKQRLQYAKEGYDGLDIAESKQIVVFPERMESLKQKVRSTFYDSLDVPKEDLIIRNGDGVAMSIRDAEAYAATVNDPMEIVKDTLNYWFKHGKETKGGQMIKNEGLAGESDAYRRISEHNPFYSNFYKQFKRAPSKADYELEIKNQLESGGGSMVEKDLSDAYQLVKTRKLENEAIASTYEPASVTPEQTIAKAQRSQPQPQAKTLPRQIKTAADKGNRSSNLVPDTQAQIDPTYDTNSTPVLSEAQIGDYVKSQSSRQDKARKAANGSAWDKTKEVKSDFKEKFIDDLSPIEDRLNKAIKGGAVVDPKEHITYQLDRSRRSEGVMNAYIKDNGLDKVIQDVPDTKEFDQYLIARHAKELDADIKTGRDPKKDAALIQALEGKYGEAAKKVYQYNQKLLDTSAEYGLISKEMAQSLKRQYPDYVPFNRIFNEDELTKLHGSGSGDASISSQSAVKKIKGSSRAIDSPLNSIIDKTRVVVEQGERNRAAQMLTGYEKLPGNPFNLKEIPANETIGTRSTISFLDGGKKRTFEVDPEIEEAAKHMSREQIGLWGRIAAIPARALRAGATTVNAGFAGANIVKDVVGATINSKHPVRVADPRALGKALSAALHHNGKNYQELMREGVSGTSFDMYRNPNKSNVAELRSQKNIGTRAAYNLRPDRWYRTIENTIGRSEDFGRALQYYSNKSGFESELGKGSVEAKLLAADQARNNSTNFFRHGRIGKNVNLAIPYWNAGVQGARIQTRRIAQNPVATLTKMGVLIAAPSAMVAASNYATPERREVMDNISDYEKEGNIIILGDNPTFNEETGRWDDVYKFPVPPQHNGIHTAIQAAVASMTDGREYDVIKHLGNITQNYTTVNPVDARDTANSYTPQAVKLAAEPMTNTNFFTGNKIVPDSQKNLPAKDQSGDYTSGTAKALGNTLNLSPRVIDNTMRTGFGGAGQNLLNLSDTALSKVGVVDKKDVRGKSIGDSIAHRFKGATAVPASEKAEKEFGKLKQQVLESSEYKSASAYDKSRMLNRLQSDLEAVAWDKSGKSDNKLTAKQTRLKDQGFDKSIYTNLDSKTTKDKSKDTGWTDEYHALKKDLAENSSKLSEIQRYDKENQLKTLETKRHFSKNTTKLYDMAEKKIYSFLDGKDEKEAAKHLDAAVRYGDKMVEAGLWTTNKLRDKNGNVQYARGYTGGTKISRGASGRKSSGGRKTASKGKGGRKSAKGKFTYALDEFAKPSTTSGKSLRELLSKAKMKKGIA